MSHHNLPYESQKTKSKIRELIYRLDNRLNIDYNRLTKLELVKKCKSYDVSRIIMLDTIKKLRLEIMYYQRLDIHNSKYQLGVEIKRLNHLINELEIANNQLKFLVSKYSFIGGDNNES